jgi:RNA polymerase sigma-70 factor (ECF subfamily)
MGEVSWDLLLAEQLRHNGRLYFRLAHNILRDTSMSEDMCQQALLRAWEQRDRLDPSPLSLKGWLARTVVNNSLQVLRRGKIEQRVVAAQATKPAQESHDGHATAETREAILAAVARLPEETRLVVAMRLLEGMSGMQVKELLGCSSAEVSRQLHRGMDELRRVLGEVV